MCELRITHTWRETTNFLGPILPYEGVLFWNRAYFSLDFSWHWLIGNYPKSEVTYPKSETVVMLNWCWSAVWWKNNLPTQITPLTQKSGPVITGGDISVIQKQQGKIFLVILWQKRKSTVVLMATSSLCYILLNEIIIELTIDWPNLNIWHLRIAH